MSEYVFSVSQDRDEWSDLMYCVNNNWRHSSPVIDISYNHAISYVANACFASEDVPPPDLYVIFNQDIFDMHAGYYETLNIQYPREACDFGALEIVQMIPLKHAIKDDPNEDASLCYFKIRVNDQHLHALVINTEHQFRFHHFLTEMGAVRRSI